MIDLCYCSDFIFQMRYYNEINDISAINLKYGQSLYNNLDFLFCTFILRMTYDQSNAYQ